MVRLLLDFDIGSPATFRDHLGGGGGGGGGNLDLQCDFSSLDICFCCLLLKCF